MDDDEPQRICECGHPIGHYPGSEMFHIRKGCEFSVTCWQCGCRHAVERMNDLRVPEPPPEIVNVMNYVKDRVE